MRKNKKSQITVFIILGIVILAAVGIAMYYKYLKPEAAPAEFGKEIKSIKLYTQQCVEQISKEGLILLGQQGGHLDVSNYDLQGAVLDTSNAKLLALDQGTLFVPYWYYKTGFLAERSEAPKLDKEYDGDNSIQDQLETYIETRLPECVNDFKAYQKQAVEVVAEKLPSAKVVFADKGVDVTVDYPIKATVGGNAESVVESFNKNIPVRLREIYSLAFDITKYEDKTKFLEWNARDLIAIYSRVDKNFLPPVHAVRFTSCSEIEYWFENQVNDNFKNMLASNIPFIRVTNSKYDKIVITSSAVKDDYQRNVQQGVFDQMAYKVSEGKYPDINVNFAYYYDFPLELDFGRKGFLEPKSMEANLIFAKYCLFDYKFMYNFKYPVLIALVDDKSKIDEQPYMFQFPIQVIVRDNFPRFSVSELMNVPKGEVTSYDCDPEQRISGDITLNVLDEKKKPVNDASVLFQCGPLFVSEFDKELNITKALPFAKRCTMGRTDEKGVLTARYPLCQVGGIITLARKGYVERQYPIANIVKDSTLNANITLNTAKKVNIDLQKIYIKPPARGGAGILNPGIVYGENNLVKECNSHSEPSPVAEYERALIRMTKLDRDETGAPESIPLVFYDPTNETRREVELAPGKYSVDISLIRNERYKGEMTIRKGSENIHIPATVVTESKDINYPENDTLIQSTFTGGSVYHEFVVSESELYADTTTTLTLYTFDEGMPFMIEQVGEPMLHVEACSQLNKNLIKPRFS